MDPAPEHLARGFDLDALREDEAVVVALDHEDRITWVNDAWSRFAQDNGGTEAVARGVVGRSYLDGVHGPLRGFFARAFARVREEGDPWELSYECSSPELYRMHRVRVAPTAGAGLLMVHGILETRPHDRVPEVAEEKDFRDARGVMVQCSNCRRVRRIGDGWRWVPGWVATPSPPVSHGLCAACEGLYLEQSRRRRAARRGGVK